VKRRASHPKRMVRTSSYNGMKNSKAVYARPCYQVPGAFSIANKQSSTVSSADKFRVKTPLDSLSSYRRDKHHLGPLIAQHSFVTSIIPLDFFGALKSSRSLFWRFSFIFSLNQAPGYMRAVPCSSIHLSCNHCFAGNYIMTREFRVFWL
jgi:hypothetical protein